jgi:hypothetical protein
MHNTSMRRMVLAMAITAVLCGVALLATAVQSDAAATNSRSGSAGPASGS